jgi:hypothetical protein
MYMYVGTQVGTIQAAINKINSQGQSDVASALRQLAEGVTKANQLGEEQQKEILDVLAELASQAERSPEQRSMGVIRSTMAHLPSMLGLAGDLTTLWDKYGDVLRKFFGV